MQVINLLINRKASGHYGHQMMPRSPDVNISAVALENLIPSASARWTRNYLPDYIADVMSVAYVAVSVAGAMNIIEAFLYLAIFRNMKRYRNDFIP